MIKIPKVEENVCHYLLISACIQHEHVCGFYVFICVCIIFVQHILFFVDVIGST